MNIKQILLDTGANSFYVERYIKFIESRSGTGKIVKHHILPKGEFPEYKNLKIFTWNLAKLTEREHFIAHWMLWKILGDSQISAFYAMAHKDKHRINSKTYAILKNAAKLRASSINTGKTIYKDIHGNKIYCSCTDPRVLSGELVGHNKGNKHGPQTEESRKLKSAVLKEAKKNLNKKQKIYFLEHRTEVLYHGDIFVEYLEQGWSTSCTSEYRIAISRETSKKMTPESRKKSALSNSITKRGKKTGPRSTETRKNMRRSGKNHDELYFCTSTNEFISCDELDKKEDYVKVFTHGRIIFDLNGNKRHCNKSVPTPSGYFDSLPSEKHLVYNIKTMCINFTEITNITGDDIFVRKEFKSNKKLKKLVLPEGQIIYVPHTFFVAYGTPANCN